MTRRMPRKRVSNDSILGIVEAPKASRGASSPRSDSQATRTSRWSIPLIKRAAPTARFFMAPKKFRAASIEQRVKDAAQPRFPSDLLPTAYCPLPTAHCLLPTAHCPLPTAHRSQP
jgi:hypothetical protein